MRFFICPELMLLMLYYNPRFAFVIYLGLSGCALNIGFLWLQLYGRNKLPDTLFNAGRLPALEMVPH